MRLPCWKLVLSPPRRTLAINIALCIFALTAVFSVFQNLCWSQEKKTERNVSGFDATALKRLLEEYDSHMGKQAAMESTYQRLSTVFLETQNEIAELESEMLRQQFAAQLTTMQAIDFSMSTPRPSATESRDRKTIQQQNAANNQYVATVNEINKQLTMRSEQVRQLSNAERVTIKRRLEAMQDLAKLQRDVATWKQKLPTFLDSYWRFSDPEGIHTKAENEEILAALKLATPSNLSARIIQGLVELRLGQTQEALESLNKVVIEETALSPVAMAARGLVHAVRNEKKEAKTNMQNALKVAPKNLLVVWLKCQMDVVQGDFAGSKKELAILTKEQDHEIAARRRQAVLGSIRSGKTARESAIALQHAQLVSDLTGSEDWYSELVLGMALNATGNSIEAQAKAEHARLLAKDENVALCDNVLAWIETKEPIEWKFFR
jgi:tetratricopeptide (TPR) repeat protein